MGAFRDDRDARVAKLEQELGDANRELARLRAAGAGGGGWLGGPTRVELERVVEGELSEEAIEALVGTLRLRFGQPGRVERLGKTISWLTEVGRRNRGRQIAVRFTVRDGKTRIQVEERMGQLAGGLFGGIVGGLGGSGAINLAVWAAIAANPLLAVGAIAWLGVTYGIVRASFGALSRTRARALAELATQLESAARDAIPATPVKTRAPVAESAADVVEEEVAHDEADSQVRRAE